MRRPRVPVLLVLAALACACGSSDAPRGQATSEPTPCAGLLSPSDQSLRVPHELPVLDGHTLFGEAKQGATRVWFAYAPGDDVVAVRDEIAEAYERAGYSDLVMDAEPPAEAELQFTGRYEGSVQVTPVCAGTVQIRYRVSD